MSKSNNKERKSKMTVAEAGKRGGEKTAETHDRGFYEEIGSKGGQKVADERGSEFYSEIGTKGGSKGGAERAKQHEGTPEAAGKTSLEEAGHRGGQRVRTLVEEGKEHEEE